MYSFQNRYVRDLAWSIGSASFLDAPLSQGEKASFFPSSFWIQEFNQQKAWLEKLDQDPSSLEKHISQKKPTILGKYYECLLDFWLRNRSDVIVRATNLQVHHEKRTIGEFDFLYYDEQTQKEIHLETAIKFYLGHGDLTKWSSWIGPQCKDTLERKLKKLLYQQTILSHDPQAKKQLEQMGIKNPEPKLIVKGYLFYPWKSEQEAQPNLISPDHLKGWWVHFEESKEKLRGKEKRWVVLEKMSWLSPVYHPPEYRLFDSEELFEYLGKIFSTTSHPTLIAELQRDDQGNWEEASRGFIVKNQWPEKIV